MHYSTLFLGLLAGPALAAFTFNTSITQGFTFDGRLPASGVSPACSAAYSAPINCDASLLQLADPGTGSSLYTKDGLDKVCTTGCIDSLNDWNKEMHQACTVQDQVFAENNNLTYLDSVLGGIYIIQENLYWPFCFKGSKTGTYCLIDKDLPEWPPISKHADSAATSAFCESDCRVQESFLMNRYYNDYDLIDAEVECKGINFSWLPMSLDMKAAFGYAQESQEGVVGLNKGGKLVGGGKTWESILKGSIGSSGSNTGSAAAGEQKGAAAKVGISGLLFSIAVAGAVLM